ncbi:hypothetical protein AVEN_138973-1 [Araneus ventricosus]|uniref:Uncharacterized protein n=1 Tax=Araneus ventricosus TaxID=182803 RepID=A0A4Y2N6D3_ARAVE|nr:hypothetical protein AVEN_138973-1 [Araneus ventricosus]
MTRTIPEPIPSSPNFSTTSMIGRLTIDSLVDQITLGPHICRFLDGIGFRIWHQYCPEAEPLPPGHLGSVSSGLVLRGRLRGWMVPDSKPSKTAVYEGPVQSGVESQKSYY